ncbi:amino acid kinase family protein [Haloplasma contractile]|uniref:aspartate kinase n=1 Tax=Haloplasma contractile SSD-17B TaxID=1033810 RepID=U2EGF0_9MOLU|nr:aspartate kinase [Haloplasma contractile]ERJ13691.1 aspartate kinase protein [Haloplasma contractile SSD-17B]
MKLVVLKFGGTSIRNKNYFLKAMNHIKNELTKGHKIICVVSAMGRMGEPYSTDTLKSLVSYQISKKEQDRLLSCGEIISSVVFSDFLLVNGIKSISLSTKDTGIKTDGQFTNANITAIDDSTIKKTLESHDVVVIPGFQGLTKDREITTLGRGGSDTTAIALGIKLNAFYVDIVSDVEGIMTADPKLVKNAKRITKISYDDLLTMTKNGAKVLHYKAASLAKQSKIKLRFLSIDHPESYTEIVDESISNTVNITSKARFVRYDTKFDLKRSIFSSFVDEYENFYYVDEDNESSIDIFLNNSGVNYKKEYGYVKISVINHKNDPVETILFTNEENLKDKLNNIHQNLVS